MTLKEHDTLSSCLIKIKGVKELLMQLEFADPSVQPIYMEEMYFILCDPLISVIAELEKIMD